MVQLRIMHQCWSHPGEQSNEDPNVSDLHDPRLVDGAELQLVCPLGGEPRVDPRARLLHGRLRGSEHAVFNIVYGRHLGMQEQRVIVSSNKAGLPCALISIISCCNKNIVSLIF